MEKIFSRRAQEISAQFQAEPPKLGDLRKIAKELKKDHELALELWETANFHSRLLAILIMDTKRIDEPLLAYLFKDIHAYSSGEANQLADWLMANQLTKNKITIDWMKTWQNDPLPLKRRLFWCHQGRLRWMGQTPPGNTSKLIAAIEKDIANEAPEVQWAMNFTAGWIGIFDSAYRNRCIAIGESTGLFKNEKVSRNCTPNYLPEFIAIEAAKRNL